MFSFLLLSVTHLLAVPLVLYLFLILVPAGYSRWNATEDREKNVIVNDLRHFFLEVRRLSLTMFVDDASCATCARELFVSLEVNISPIIDLSARIRCAFLRQLSWLRCFFS